MQVCMLGLNFKTAPVELRECLAFSGAQQVVALAQLRAQAHVRGAVILSTCNRVELYLSTEDPQAALKGAVAFLCQFHQVTEERVQPHLYQRVGPRAVTHLLRVACGLDSMIVGEAEVLGQLKTAFACALEQKATDKILAELFRRALRVGKWARTETTLGKGVLSVGYAAVELAKHIFGDLRNCTVLILGAGKMGRITAQHFANQRVGRLLVANRTYERAAKLATQVRGEAVEYTHYTHYLPEVDILVSATNAPSFVLDYQLLRQALPGMRRRPLFLIDIAVPRNIDPQVGKLPNVFLYDIDDLEGVITTLAAQNAEFQRIHRQVEVEGEDFQRWLQSLAAQPIIVTLQRRAEEICQAEVKRVASRLGNISPREKELIASLAHRVAAKILHDPFVQIRQLATGPDAEVQLATVRELFGLEG